MNLTTEGAAMHNDTPTHVLLVSDHAEEARLIAAAHAESGGGACDHVVSLAAALARLAAGPVGVVLLDLDLGPPEGRGLDTLRALRRVACDTPVIALTAVSDDDTRDLAVRAGAADCLGKGELDGRSLAGVIQRALAGQRLQREHARSERRYGVLLATMSEGVLIADRDARVIDANPAAAAMLGVSLATLRGHTLDELDLAFVGLDGQPAASADRPDRRPPRGGDPVVETVLGLAHEASPGGVRWISWRAARCASGDVGPGEVCTLLTDVTAERHGAAAVAQNDQRLQLLLDLLQAPVADLSTLLDRALEAALALTGSRVGYVYTYSEDKQQFVLNSWSREVMDACSVMAPQTTYELAQTGLWGEVVRQRRPILVNAFAQPHPLKRGFPEGHVALDRYLSVPVFDGGRIVAVVGVGNKAAPYTQTDQLQLSLLMDAVWRAVRRLQAEQAQRATAAQLVQSQKMEAVGRLAGGLAHDFNNLLSVIINRAEFGLFALPADHPACEDLREIRLAGDRAATLVRQVLTFSRRQVLEFVPVDLNVILTDFERMLRRLLSADIRLEVKCAPELWETVADRAQLEQALANLVVNARDAMPHGGTITVETRNVALDDAQVPQLAGARPGEFVRLTVSDTGAGMDEGTLARLFEPYFSTKDGRAGGDGGLAMVQGLVQQCHGFVAVRSAPGEGTTFEISLPRAQARGHGVPAPSPAVVPGQHRGALALVVEDDPSVRAVIARILDAAGFEVTAVGRASEALVTCERAARPLDLLVSDVIMPLMNGPELAAHVKRLHPGVAVLFVSGHADGRFADQAGVGEAPPLLLKPFDAATLLGRVDALLAHHGARRVASEEPEARSAAPGEDPTPPLPPPAEPVPADLASRLIEALRRARLDDAEGALAELEVTSPRTAATLRDLLARFDYDGAMQWLQRAGVSPQMDAP